MAIDPMLYKKYNNRKTDLDIGGTLASDAARKVERDGQPKGVGGGLRHGMWNSNLPWWLMWMRWWTTFGSKNPRK